MNGAVLAIESATERVGVALADASGLRASVEIYGGRRHGESITPAVAHLLTQTSATLGDLDVIAVDVGPGLFTGLRVGLASAKGFAQGLGIPIVALSSLELLALAAFDAGVGADVEVVSVVDARRGDVFVGRFVRTLTGATSSATSSGGCALPVLRSLGPSVRRTPEELGKELAASTSGSHHQRLLVGDGALRHRDRWCPLDSVELAGVSLASPSSALLARCAQERITADPGLGVTPGSVVPIYLRDADTRIGWARREPAVVPVTRD